MSKVGISRNGYNTYVLQVWMSKNSWYENPYSITGTIKLAGLY
ncbi:hypothetical protein [Clostridium beijerinckii]|nr:hypothetical protein [Clostridium beijerinckii]NRZ26704.1 hypothetical protein [Clostridium beijerinckii]NRZ26743.1 hypothetical protein [Clostridium beijerinckii]NRZ28206.1 hypothetical protein [Clostridium beijerinckii]NYB96019.1 hypothetical protein [Clostridium beijerinckii]NYB97457.1 hypothetical protein [Clostridium beijerinckii]